MVIDKGNGRMMSLEEQDTDDLVRRAASGDRLASRQIFTRHRARLREMVAVRMDPRIASRIDASDIVQDALAEAAQKLDQYLGDQPLPFYPWLRQFAWNRLVDAHRRNLHAQKRSVRREVSWDMDVSDRSAMHLAGQLIGSGTSPSGRLARAELRARVRECLAQLRSGDREVLVLRHLEGLSTREVAAVLEMNQEAVKKRLVRALQRFRDVLTDELAE